MEVKDPAAQTIPGPPWAARAGSEMQTKTVNRNTDNARTGVIIFMILVLLRQAASRASMLPHFANG